MGEDIDDFPLRNFYIEIMKKTLAILIGIALIAYAIFKTLLGPSGLMRQYAIEGENHRLNMEIDSLQAEIIRKEKEIEGLKKDVFLIEKKARTELGMTKEGEMVFRFRKVDSTQSQQP